MYGHIEEQLEKLEKFKAEMFTVRAFHISRISIVLFSILIIPFYVLSDS